MNANKSNYLYNVLVERSELVLKRNSEGKKTNDSIVYDFLGILYTDLKDKSLIMKKVLIACEYSGKVRDAFTKKGFDAMSCDFLETETPGKHYKGDLRDLLNDHWDLMVGFPTCTFMCNSGVRHLHTDAKRWLKLFESTDFFKLLWNADIENIGLENPIMHKYAKRLIGGVKQSQIIQPWQFGHGETKATCLWLKNLPLLEPTNVVEGREQRIWKLPPGTNRWKERSRTFEGIANAMADQWGNYLYESNTLGKAVGG